MTIQRLRSTVSDDFEAVNALIVEKIQSQVSLIDDLTHHIIDSGGKRLRPLLVLLASRASGYQGADHIKLAAMVEFFHTATLLHDDVIDESKMRRGKKTANEIWGSKASILVGDYLFSQYMKLLVEIGNIDIMRLLTDVSHEVGRGEIDQLSHRNDPTLSEKAYFEVIYSKTSILFAASSKIGAMLNHAPHTQQEALYEYGLHLGNAFQLIDDALDYCSDSKTLGKNIGDDLADGKATLPLIYALKHGSPKQRDIIRTSLKEGTLTYLNEIQEAIESTHAIDYTRQVASSEVDIALTALQVIPDTIYKTTMIDLAQYAVSRNH